MNALAEESSRYDVGISPEIQWYPDYASPDTYLYSHLPILNKEQLCQMYPACFNGIGKFKNNEYHIKLEDDARPFVHPVRNISLPFKR